MPGLAVVRPMPDALTSVDVITSWMHERGIDRQIVGTWADLFGYALPASEGAHWCRLHNELQASELDAAEHLTGLAILPLQDTGATLDEIEAAYRMGYRAVTIGCDAGHRQLDDGDLAPVWAELAEREMPVVMHPTYRVASDHLADLGLPNTIGRPHDTDVAVARLVLSGVLGRHEGTRLVLMHGGGSIPLLWGRLERNHAVTAGTADPDAARDRLWVDSVVYRPEALEFLVCSLGEDRVLLGSDHPFPIRDPEPRRVVEHADLTGTARRKLLGANAARLFAR